MEEKRRTLGGLLSLLYEEVVMPKKKIAPIRIRIKRNNSEFMLDCGLLADLTLLYSTQRGYQETPFLCDEGYFNIPENLENKELLENSLIRLSNLGIIEILVRGSIGLGRAYRNKYLGFLMSLLGFKASYRISDYALREYKILEVRKIRTIPH